MSAEELAKKKRQRGGHRGSVTKMLGQLDTELAKPSPDRTQVLQLKRSLDAKLVTLKHLDAEILDLIEEETVIADEIEQSDILTGTMYSAIIRADESFPPAATSASAIVTPRTAHVSIPHDRVKLLTLTLRSFSGDVTQWPTFWDSFKAAVHENDRVVPIDKFNYLKSLLSGTALEAISGLTLTASNYRDAVEILEKRFGNRQQIISKHMDLLLNVTAVSSPNNLTGLRHLYDFVEMHTRSLTSLGVTSDSYGTLLSSVLINKLPSDVRLLISRNVSGEEWKLDKLLKALHNEPQARERVVVEKSVPNAPGNPSSGKGARQGSIPTSHQLVSGVNPSITSCCYCQQNHSPKDCMIVTQVEARKQILRKSGRCYGCLRTGHVSRECRSKSRCSRCNKRHHTSICSGESGTNKTEPQLQQHIGNIDQKETGSKLNVDAPPFPGKQSTATLCVAAKGTVLLQTAVTSIQNPEQPNLNKPVRAVLDLGSQRSYITQKAATSLQLRSKGIQQMSIMTFGSAATQTKCELVHVLMKTLCGEMELRLLTTPIICEPLNTCPITLGTNSYEHISDLILADEFDRDGITEVDMLLGADYYWELATG